MDCATAGPKQEALVHEVEMVHQQINDMNVEIAKMEAEHARLESLKGRKLSAREVDAVNRDIQRWNSEARSLKSREAALRAHHDQVCSGHGGWGQRIHGYTSHGDEVTIRTGTGHKLGHTLISDGHLSRDDFDERHDHHGPKREPGGGWFSEERGHYTNGDR